MSIPVRYLMAAVICAGKKDTRHYLNGVHVTPDYIVSTDGARLFSVECDTGMKRDIIIPNEAISQFVKTLSSKQKKEGDVYITHANDGFMSMSLGTVPVLFKPINGRFPDWRRVLPAEYEPSVHTCYQWGYMADFEKMDKILSGGLHPFVELVPNRFNNALVVLKSLPNAICVLIPKRA